MILTRVSSLLAVSFALMLLSGCGAQNNNGSPHPPNPDSIKGEENPGTPLLFFGGGSDRGSVGADDPEYQDYLLWKEWQQYQKYQEWLRSKGGHSAEPATGSNTE